ncbi:helix-turn-helix transcriptional regulator [Micromonospora humi]|uniref:Ribosome-binding protein aMBF1, putative translation factor, contains Zn-ribbon and HTH domains n=1 Tax=Micromonospora humi TaxID=745366 RepID=A0A1C5J5F7_9ACTN|nr:helix-turn-helix domain-containing protein [Micromonospora humi]SCG65775.1 ribosome-binding protein aMBF1, putative translation factor, contains Zn-ribbon and HTH domains [Micromonospora humi]
MTGPFEDTAIEATTAPARAPEAVAPCGGATAVADDESPALLTEPLDVPFPAAGIVRAVRRRAHASQRELARFARVHPTTVGRIEAGALAPSLTMLSRLVGTAGFRLVVVDESGTVLKPMRDRADLRDGAERRYPSHLDVVVDPQPGEWWADIYGLARPPETFYRDRAVRDALRRRSQWEVRVAKYRNVPPPPDPQRDGYRGGPPIRW